MLGRTLPAGPIPPPQPGSRAARATGGQPLASATSLGQAKPGRDMGPAQQGPWPIRAGLWVAGDQHPTMSLGQGPTAKWGPGPWAGWGEAVGVVRASKAR